MDTSSPSARTVNVALRSSLAARIGRPRATVQLPATATAGDLRAALADAYPDAAPLIERALVADGDRILGRTDPLPPKANLALIPPVSGG